MKILKSWLLDHIKSNLTNEEIAEMLSSQGISVEDYSSILDDKVLVGEIKEIFPHPNADRLQIAKVFNGDETLTVVCGAPNIAVGQKVPLATIGAILPNCLEIKKAEIRGTESWGMLCAADELGIGADHAGIYILPDNYEVGKKLNEYLEHDAVFDLEITPNRGDCLYHYGIAREIAAGSKQVLVIENTEIIQSKDDGLSVRIEADKHCSQYYALPIHGVKIGASPKWLSDRLLAVGVNPINNVVDATNYIMMDMGQPLHAFDAKKIAQDQIVIRLAKLGESITTLDKVKRNLTDKILVIADKDKPIAIAGIMGGSNSEIEASTTEIIIESAEFNPVTIRKGAKSLGLSTEASYRFERGIDSGNVERSLQKAAKFIVDLAGGKIGSIVKDGGIPEKAAIRIEHSKINHLLGYELSDEEIDKILSDLGFELKDGNVLVPLWRHDIECWQDLAEEVGRIFNYDNIKKLEMPLHDKPVPSDYYKRESIKDVLTSAGFSEILSYSFLSEADIEAAKLQAEDLLEIENPLQPENKYLRNSLLPGLLKAVAKNPTFDPVLLFETSKIFTKTSETPALGIVASGKNSEKILQTAIDLLQNNFSLKLDITELSRDDLAGYKIRKPSVLYIEVPLEDIYKGISETNISKLVMPQNKSHYRQLSKFPSVTRDLAFIVDKSINAEEITDSIYSISEKINRVELFDEFASDKFGKDKKNVAYHLYLQDMEKTMTDKDADRIIQNVITDISKKYNAELRKF